MTTASEALKRLQEGNARYAAGEPRSEMLASPDRRDELVASQSPFAVILGCADSRVPAELVFDQGLGDLFVVRVAGNIAASSQVGSIEYAAAVFGARLVVVLGHSNCGAIAATVDEVSKPSGMPSPSLTTLVDRIRPSVEELVQNADGGDRTFVAWYKGTQTAPTTSGKHGCGVNIFSDPSGAVYLSPADQEKMPFATGKLLRWNHFGRKVIQPN